MKLRILCIDDSRSVHAFLKSCVDELASEVIQAFDGQEGIAKLMEARDRVDLVFLDWEMPLKTGPEVLAEAREKGIKVPIIMLTSKNEVEDIARVLGLGASEYIMKPFTKDLIVEKVAEVMANQGAG